MKKIIALILASVLALSLVACSSTTEEETIEETAVEEIVEETTEEETESEPVYVKPVVTSEGNVYTVVYTENEASAKPYLTEMTVVVELDDDINIISVEVIENIGVLSEYATKALTDVPAAIVEENKIEADIRAGATITTNAIKASVATAMSTASNK